MSPLHMVNLASVRNLQAAVREQGNHVAFDHTLFRANIVFDSSIAYSEDLLQEARIDNILLRTTSPCKRCKAMAINSETRDRDEHMQPYTTLCKQRMLKGIGPVFGIYSCLEILSQQEFTSLFKDLKWHPKTSASELTLHSSLMIRV